VKKQKLHFKNLSLQTTASQLAQLCSNIGMVRKFRIVKDPVLMRPTGAGIIEMNDPQDADACISKLNGMTFMGQVISVSWANGWAKGVCPTVL